MRKKISKRILLLTVCLVMLTIATGYVLLMEVSSLRSQLEKFQRENAQLKYRISMMHARPLNGCIGVHISEGNNISTQVVDLMEDYGAQIIFSNENLEYVWSNVSIIVIFDAGWIAENIDDTELHDFIRNATPKEAKLVAIGGNTSKFFEALDKAGVYELPVTETGWARNPAYSNPPMVGYKWRKATTPNGIEYFGDSILISETYDIDQLVQALINWN